MEKRVLDAVVVPEELRDHMPRQYQIWVTYSDLRVFVERPDRLPDDDAFAHGRDAVARVAWLLIRKMVPAMEATAVFDHLAQLASDAEIEGFALKMGDTTLKSCIREILAAGNVLEGNG